MGIARFDVHLVRLGKASDGPARPCAIVSPDEMNEHLHEILVAPMTTARRGYPTRIDCTFDGTRGQVALDQILTVEVGDLVARLGALDARTQAKALRVLHDMFAA